MKKYIAILVLIIATVCLADIFQSHLKPGTNNALDVGIDDSYWRTFRGYTFTDGIANWTSNSLSGFTSISGTTLTDGVFTVSGGIISAGTWQGGTITVPYGGTGASTLTDGGLLVGSGTGAITALGVASNGQIPIGDGTTDPVLATIIGSSGITVTNAAGSITLDVNDSGVDHGGLTGLGDDDHSHYFADTTIGARTADFNTTGTVFAEQVTSTDDITMQGHLLTLGNDTANDIVISFKGSQSDGNITFDESAGEFEIDSNLTIAAGEILTTGHILPIADNTHDLGSVPQSWRSIWIDAIATIAQLNVTQIGTDLWPTATDTHDVGASGLAWKDLWLSGDADVTGSITGGSLVTGGDIGISGDTNLLQLAANALTVNGTVTATGAGNFAGLTLNLTQDYVFGDRGSGLTISGQTSGNPVDIETFAADGDGTDDVYLHLYGYGTSGSVANSHRMTCGWDASDANYIIHTLASGDQTVKELKLYTSGNPGQLVLGIDGNNTMSGDLAVTGDVTANSFLIDATADHTFTDSSDDLVITNPNSDKDIIFNINDGGTQKNFMTLDASASSLVLAAGTLVLGDVIDVSATNTTVGAGASSGMKFALTQTGTKATYALFGTVGLNNNAASTSIAGAYLSLSDSTTDPTNNHTKTGLFIRNTAWADSIGSNYIKGGTSADRGIDIDLGQLKGYPDDDYAVNYELTGQKISRDGMLIYNAFGGSWTGDVTTYGLHITGWGSADVVTGIAGTYTNLAIYVDGGTSVFMGNVGIGTATPTAALQMGDDKLIALDTNAGIIASTTQTQGQGALTAQINEIATIANANDTVTLPSAIAGVEIEIINNGVNTLLIFPALADNLGLGPNTPEELQANERVKFVAYNTTNWAKESTTEIIHAEIHDEDNTDAFVINDPGGDFHSYHTNGLAAGDLADWAFDLGGAGTSHAIASIADAGGGDITVTTGDNHLLAVGDIISQTNLADANYVGVFDVLTVPSTTTYTVTATYGATGTGTMDQAATLEADAVAAGVYSFAYCISAKPVGNQETFDFQLYKEATAVIGSKIRRKFGAQNDFGSMSGCGVINVGSGEKISLAISNEDSAANLTIRNLTIVLIRL